MHQFREGSGKRIPVLSLIIVEHKMALLSIQACGVAECFLLTFRAIVCCSSPGCGLVGVRPFQENAVPGPRDGKLQSIFA